MPQINKVGKNNQNYVSLSWQIWTHDITNILRATKFTECFFKKKSDIFNNTMQAFHMVANGNTIQKVSKKKDNTSD